MKKLIAKRPKLQIRYKMSKIDSNRSKSTTNIYSYSNRTNTKYESYKKEYKLREKESDFHKEALEITYDRSIENRLFPMDTELMVLTSSTPKSKKTTSKATIYNPPLSIFFTPKSVTPNKRRDSSVSKIGISKPMGFSKHTSYTSSSPYLFKH